MEEEGRERSEKGGRKIKKRKENKKLRPRENMTQPKLTRYSRGRSSLCLSLPTHLSSMRLNT